MSNFAIFLWLERRREQRRRQREREMLLKAYMAIGVAKSAVEIIKILDKRSKPKK